MGWKYLFRSLFLFLSWFPRKGFSLCACVYPNLFRSVSCSRDANTTMRHQTASRMLSRAQKPQKGHLPNTDNVTRRKRAVYPPRSFVQQQRILGSSSLQSRLSNEFLVPGEICSRNWNWWGLCCVRRKAELCCRQGCRAVKSSRNLSSVRTWACPRNSQTTPIPPRKVAVPSLK